LRGAGIDVVAFGPSLHDGDSYFLMRAFATKEERERAEAAFYSNPLWVDGPRNAVLAAIVTYSTVVISIDPQTLKGLRMPTHAGTDSAADVSRLTQLNQDYIDAVKTSNVGRFQEILAEDFLCTTADGTLLDRAAFLEQAGRPTTVSALQAHDVNIRLVGDTAIVHAATTFTHPDGRPGRGRYTDVWARRNGQWVAVAAQFFRQ
jgi:ketosteroid isomerase-like protein